MDAHVFRRVVHALIPLLTGARLEKVQSPAPDVHVFTWYARQRKHHLTLGCDRRSPFLYLAPERPAAAAPPSAQTMRLRKHCRGRRVAACVVHWPERRLHLLFQKTTVAGAPPPETWLTLDMREGPLLGLGKAPLPPVVPLWPEAEELETACAHWRQWPVLTPALRRVLPHMEPPDQAALLEDLREGGGDLFMYATVGGGREIFAWPLPEPLRNSRAETVETDPLAAAAQVGGALALGSAAAKDRAAAPFRREAHRLARLLDKLTTEEARLGDMAALQAKALALQAALWRFAPEERAPEAPVDDARFSPLKLDARLTVRENMQALFHKAGRGRRGLAHVERRRRMLEEQLRQALSMAEGTARREPPAPGKDSPPAREGTRPAVKGVETFRSSDGFIILRGRDAKGNVTLLRMAAPHDLWLHAAGGPGAHALIRRDHAGQEIPERTLREAAALAAAKSWTKNASSALILCAQARHVHPMRGAAPGTVRVDKTARTVQVVPDREMETRLSPMVFSPIKRKRPSSARASAISMLK